ncbi:MAG: GNAT family N-acetyltransferase [Clostridia bacterium]|nr:GNAT family N-acetyltransferase [Clostridia bacterium]
MVYLKKLSKNDDIKIYNMLQEIDANDNGFHNKVFGMDFQQYKKWLENEYAVDNGKLEDWMVPQTSFWMYDGNEPIGYGRIRHYLNDNLKNTSGHIGYAIRKSKRGQGYGNKILRLLISECMKLEINQIQIAANKNNILSNKVILKNGGVLFKENKEKNFYHIDCKNM